MKNLLIALVLVLGLAMPAHAAHQHSLRGRLSTDFHKAVAVIKHGGKIAAHDTAVVAKVSSHYIREGFHAAAVTLIETIVLTDLAALELRFALPGLLFI